MLLKKIKIYLKLLRKYPVDKNWLLKNKYQLENFIKNNPVKEPDLKRSMGSLLISKPIKSMSAKFAIPVIAGIIIFVMVSRRVKLKLAATWKKTGLIELTLIVVETTSGKKLERNIRKIAG